MSNTILAWLSVCLVVFALLVGLGAAELLSQALLPVTEALSGDTIIGEPWCVRADGGSCP
jgi:hypothetical protein